MILADGMVLTGTIRKLEDELNRALEERKKGER